MGVGRPARGSAEQVAVFLRALVGIGVDQVQVTFRSRHADDLYDQLEAFGAEVAELVGR